MQGRGTDALPVLQHGMCEAIGGGRTARVKCNCQSNQRRNHQRDDRVAKQGTVLGIEALLDKEDGDRQSCSRNPSD